MFGARSFVQDRLILASILALTGSAGCADDEAATTSETSSSTGQPSGSGGGGDQGGGGSSSSSSGSGAAGTTTGTTTGAGGSSSTSTGSATTTSSSSSSTGTGGGEPTEVLRFIALGDGGEGNDTQYAVSAMVANVCEARGGCAFSLYLGDNFYDNGVGGVDDGQFQSKFEAPYENLDFRFWVVLGNHDYGGNGAGYDQRRALHQVEYASMSTKFTMPSRFYGFNVPADDGPPGSVTVDFLGLDTNWIMYTGDGDQQDFMEAAIASSTATWRIAYGHHPYISNGQHGNAGEYEGIPFIPVVSGANVRDFMEDTICGDVDVYISGHDHNRQWLSPQCGTEFLVSGTAAKTTDLVGRDTDTLFEDDVDGGFLLVEIDGNTLTGDFYDQQGNLEFSRTITK